MHIHISVLLLMCIVFAVGYKCQNEYVFVLSSLNHIKITKERNEKMKFVSCGSVGNVYKNTHCVYLR